MRAAWVLVVCALGGMARAEDGPSTLKMRDMAFPVRIFNTPSGLRIILEEDHSRPIVSVVTIVDAGSSFDPAGKEGLAHVVEHLSFRARPDGKTTVTELYRRSGLGDWNATTTHDLVMYWSVGGRESLGEMLAVEGTRIVAPLLGVDAATLDSERGVVRNELLQRDEGGRATAVESRLYGQLYPSGHPYARGVGGTEQTLAAIQLADVQAFVKARYQPANATMVIAGDVDPKAIGKIMDTYLPGVFLADPPAGTPPPAPRLSTPAPTVPKLAPAPALERVRGPVDGPTLYLGWSLPRGFDSESYLQLYVQQLLDGQAIWATLSDVDIVSLDSQLEQGKTGSTLVVEVSLRDGSHPERSAEKVLDQLVGLWMPGGGEASVRSDEVLFNRMRAQTLVEIAAHAEHLSTRASARALVTHYQGDPQYLGRQLPAMAQLTVPQLSRFAYEWLSRDRARMVFVEPGGGSSARGEGGSNGVFAPSGGSRFVVPPEVLRQRVHPPGLQIRSGTLKNGLEVVVARRPSAPLVSVTLVSRGGNSTGQPLGAAELSEIAQQQRYDHGAPSMVGASRRGWKSRDASYIQFNAASGNLANAVAYVSDRVRWLHVDASSSPRMLTDFLETYRVLSLRPSAQAERSLWAEALKGSPSARRATSADLGKIGSGDVQEFIDRTLLPRSSVLVIAGDVDLDEAMQRAKQYLEDWSASSDRPGALEGVPPAQDGPVRVVRTARPGARQTELRLGCAITIEKPEDDVASEMLLSRLGGRLESLARGALAASYGFDISRARHRGFDVLDLQGLVDSGGVSRVLGVLLHEADGLGSYQVPEEDLGRLRWSLGSEFNVSLQRTRTASATLATLRTSDRPLDVVTRYAELLAGTGAADIARVAARCRKTAVVSLLGDEKTVAEALKAAGR